MMMTEYYRMSVPIIFMIAIASGVTVIVIWTLCVRRTKPIGKIICGRQTLYVTYSNDSYRRVLGQTFNKFEQDFRIQEEAEGHEVIVALVVKARRVIADPVAGSIDNVTIVTLNSFGDDMAKALVFAVVQLRCCVPMKDVPKIFAHHLMQGYRDVWDITDSIDVPATA